MSASEMALWARVESLRSSDIDVALQRERSLVRTWAMRGTVHLLAADDLPLYVSALGRSNARDTEQWLVRSGLSVDQIRRVGDAIVEALSSGPLTRGALTARAGSKFPPKVRRWLQHGWGGLLKPVCFQGRVCFGPSDGRTVTFVRRDAWLPNWRDMSEEEARRALLLRFVRAYGPAAASDFRAWSGMPSPEVSMIVEALETQVVPVRMDGKGGLIARADLRTLERADLDEPTVRLLPNFDVYLLGHSDKGHLVDAAHYKKVYRKAGWISPVVLVDGVAAGVWTHESRGRKLHVRIEAFRRLPSQVRVRILEETESLREFFGLRESAVAFA